MNRRIIIEKPTKTTDATGQKITTWSEHCRAWANLISGTAGETLQDGKQVTEDVRWQIEIRSNSLTRAITAEMRVVLGTQILSIQSAVDENEDRRKVVLTALERK